MTSHVLIDDDAARHGPIFVERRASVQAERGGRPVTHDFAALVLYVAGRARVEQRGTWIVAAGDMLVVPAGEPHRVTQIEPADAWRVGFCVPCLAADTATALLEPFERVRNGAAPVVRIPGERRAFVQSLFEELSSASPTAIETVPVRASLLTLIVHEAAKISPSTDAGAGGIAAEALRYIERHCLGPLTLNDVAAALKRSPAYITTCLTRATGRSAVAWIIAGRMAEARRRLLHSDEQVEIIAERVGYADPTHFIRLFRRFHGATPSAWRARLRDHPRSS